MKFVMSMIAIGLLFLGARYVTDVYFPDHSFLAGWFAGTIALVIGQLFD
jgi:hypothetical protein